MIHFIKKFLETNCSPEMLSDLHKAAAQGELKYKGACFLQFFMPLEQARTLPYAVAAEHEFYKIRGDENRNKAVVQAIEEITGLQYPVPYKP